MPRDSVDGPKGARGRIETFFLPGPAGRLECMLRSPRIDVRSAAAAICHPHPLFGGTMHNKVVHAVAEAIVGAGIPVLRFNFRGVGRSAGTHDGGKGEQDDLTIALDHLAERYRGRPLLAVGYSFGAYVALRIGCSDARVVALIGIGLPLTLVNFGFLGSCAKPLSLIQGEADAFGPLPHLMSLAAALPGGATVMAIKEAAHNFAGHFDDLAARVTEAIPCDLKRGPSAVESGPV